MNGPELSGIIEIIANKLQPLLASKEHILPKGMKPDSGGLALNACIQYCEHGIPAIILVPVV